MRNPRRNPPQRLRNPALPLALGLGGALGMLVPQVAWAQPPGGGMGPAGGAGGPREEKKEGPAEEAPADDKALRPLVPVAEKPERARRIQLFDMAGYLRMRGDFFHRPAFGLDTNRLRYFDPPSEQTETPVDAQGNPAAGPADGGLGGNDFNCIRRLQARGAGADRINRCSKRQGFASANMRMRLEPTLNVTDTVRVHSQIDVLDNLVLGSTPDAGSGLLPLTRTQMPPGEFDATDAIAVKRAWGEVRFGWGLTAEFGRMPHHFGMGIFANDGSGYDRQSRADIVRQLDTDDGDQVDSLRLSFDAGKDRRRTHRITASWDFAGSGATANQLIPGWSATAQGRIGQNISIDKYDNLTQWRLSVERRDDPETLQEKLALDQAVFNYGAAGWLRRQDLAAPLSPAVIDDVLAPGLATPTDFDTIWASTLYSTRLTTFTPDVWMRLNWRTMRIELEGAATFGRFWAPEVIDEDNLAEIQDNPTQLIADLGEIESNQLRKHTIASWGYALEFKYGFLRDRFHLGFDHGTASGDADGPYQPLFNNGGGARKHRDFAFNPAYKQDLLLFREVLGTVTNASYFRPWLAFFFFDDNMSARADFSYAFAPHSASTPSGTNHSYGIGIDAAVRYHDTEEPVFVQFQYGVLFPMKGFDVPDAGSKKAAQTLQGQIGIRF